MPRPSVPVPVSRRKTPPAGPSVTESTADHRFYLARELDHFPRPLVPLIPDIAVAGSVRLWVSIDRNGKVLDAAGVKWVRAEGLEPAHREEALPLGEEPDVLVEDAEVEVDGGEASVAKQEQP